MFSLEKLESDLKISLRINVSQYIFAIQAAQDLLLKLCLAIYSKL